MRLIKTICFTAFFSQSLLAMNPCLPLAKKQVMRSFRDIHPEGEMKIKSSDLIARRLINAWDNESRDFYSHHIVHKYNGVSENYFINSESSSFKYLNYISRRKKASKQHVCDVVVSGVI